MKTEPKKQLVIFPTGTLKPADRSRLDKAGYVAIEAADPSLVVCIVPSTPVVTADDTLMAAMTGLAYGVNDGARAAFFTELHSRMKSREAKPRPAK